MSTASTGSGRRRPVRRASAASITGAFPLRPVSPAAKATVASLALPAAGGRVSAGGVHGPASARQRARKAPVEELMPGTWRA